MRILVAAAAVAAGLSVGAGVAGAAPELGVTSCGVHDQHLEDVELNQYAAASAAGAARNSYDQDLAHGGGNAAYLYQQWQARLAAYNDSKVATNQALAEANARLCGS
jgi:hypothetical protein